MALPVMKKMTDNHFMVQGELNMQTVPALTRDTQALLAGADGEVEIDLSGVTRADSAGLALLAQWLRLAKRDGFSLCFQNVPAQLLQIARVSELHKILPIQD